MEDKGTKKKRERKYTRYPSKRRRSEGVKRGMSQRLIKSTGPEASRSERGKRGVSRAWEKASRFIDCKALELLPEALLLLHHPHCSIKFLHRGTDTWATVVSRGPPMPDRFFLVSSWTANISLPFWPIKRDISSPPISLNAIRRQTSSTAICVELTNCRHALRCILGGQDHTAVSLRCWTLHRRRLK